MNRLSLAVLAFALVGCGGDGESRFTAEERSIIEAARERAEAEYGDMGDVYGVQRGPMFPDGVTRWQVEFSASVDGYPTCVYLDESQTGEILVLNVKQLSCVSKGRSSA